MKDDGDIPIKATLYTDIDSTPLALINNPLMALIPILIIAKQRFSTS